MAAWGPCFLLVARGNQISYSSAHRRHPVAAAETQADTIAERPSLPVGFGTPQTVVRLRTCFEIRVCTFVRWRGESPGKCL